MKKTTPLILAITALAISGAWFAFLNDPEGPNLVVVIGLAVILFVVSLAVYLWNLAEPKRVILGIFIQILLAIALYFVQGIPAFTPAQALSQSDSAQVAQASSTPDAAAPSLGATTSPKAAPKAGTNSSTGGSSNTTTSGNTTYSSPAAPAAPSDPNAPKVGWFMEGAVPDPATGIEQMAVYLYLNGAGDYSLGNFLGICNFKKVAKMTLLPNELDAVFCKVEGEETGEEVGVFDNGGVISAQVGAFNDGTEGGTPSRSNFKILQTF